MRRSFLALATAGLVTLPLLGAVPSASAQDFAPFLSITTAPAGAKITAGEHWDGTELTNSRPVAEGPVGPVPAFVADDQFGCAYGSAAASGLTEWIAVARRGMTAAEGTDRCPGFQTKLTAATSAGADALIIVNHSPGHEAGTAAGVIPGLMIDGVAGTRLIESLNPATPNAVTLRLGLLDIETFLPPGLSPSKVSSLNASASGSSVSVNGAAVFGGEAPVTLATDDAGDGPLHADTSRQTGVDLTGGFVSQPDPANPTLSFEWKVTNLPPPSSLPEAIRYTIPFKINTASGEKTYQLQAKYSNVASVTMADDPAGHGRAPGTFFQLRGNCVANYQGAPLANCPHVAWLTGSFNATTDTVRIDLPLGQSYAPDIAPGAVLLPNVVATTTISASYQAVASNATTTDEALWGEEVTYTVPSTSVRLGIAPAGTNPDNVNFSKAATVNDSGSFTGSLDAPGPGSYEVFAKACFGSNCAVRSVPITL
jgi:hypothetical protein